jgi:hypothetical protein
MAQDEDVKKESLLQSIQMLKQIIQYRIGK